MITFDVGHTLLEAVDSLEAYREAALDLGADNYPAAELWSPLASAMADAAARRRDNRDSDEIQRDHWRGVVAHVAANFPPFSGIDTEAWLAKLWDHYGSPEAWRPYPETLDVLRSLADEGLPLAVVSNWDSRLPAILEAHGLTGFFSRVSVSAAVGVRKPDPAIFADAVSGHAVDPATVWHVGDNVDVRVQRGRQYRRIIRNAGRSAYRLPATPS